MQQENQYIQSNDILTTYIADIAGTPLLKAEEERHLFQIVEVANAAQAKLNNGATKRQRRKLSQKVEAGNEARRDIVAANTRLVIKVATDHKKKTSAVPLVDLIQEGNIGLLKSIDKFDLQRGYRFSTYATWWIRQAVSRAIADQGRTIRLPVHRHDEIRKISAIIDAFVGQHGHKPTDEEIAMIIGKDLDRVKAIMDLCNRADTSSLDNFIYTNGDEAGDMYQFVVDEGTKTTEESAEHEMMKQRLDDIVNTLKPREANVIRMRFGLGIYRPHTLDEVGQKYELTRERIRQIEKEAMRKLRHPSKSRGLRDFAMA